jgi:hypothetical protein
MDGEREEMRSLVRHIKELMLERIGLDRLLN